MATILFNSFQLALIEYVPIVPLISIHMTGDNQLIGIVWTGLEVPAAQLN